MQMLEKREPFSLRAVARQADVSRTAPYRHFADRAELESALAVEGFRALKAHLLKRGEPASTAALAELGVAYVEFALKRPNLFQLMFGNQCDTSDVERVRATTELHELLAVGLAKVFPEADATALATACWSLVHGLACLHLDGKLPTTPRTAVAPRVRGAIEAIFALPSKQ
ncbi:MAG: WHG domain-containing protein [Polyangiaceae bacterium]|nr:WHG domain-containing protein [Myxococcales bacterium]MCB9586166.1 WHG domain-containing protein [Polyangiaceae bacterium]MCB9606843.1 WHG domain-containing protein [Polyangiaceae bacterium]